jgi:Putative stress-induced transcription regulator
MAKTPNAKTAAKATKRTPSRGTTEALVPRELIVHQIGGHLALDFCNTTGEHLAAQPEELLLDWRSFLRWATQVGLGPQSYSDLIRHPKLIDAIILLRESIYRTGLAAAGVRQTSKRDLDSIRECANTPRPEIDFSVSLIYITV